MTAPRVRVISLDLDDTLWPYAPVAAEIARALGSYLASAAPRVAAMYDGDALYRSLTAPKETRDASPVHRAWLRPEGMVDRFREASEDPRLAAEALEVAAEARQRVRMYSDAEPALARLAGTYRLAAITNGTADVAKIGIASWFDAVVTAADAGAAKPDPRIFMRTCEVLRTPPEHVLHAGDDLVKDVAGALDAGLQAAWVHRDMEVPADLEGLRVADLLGLAEALGA